MTVCADCVKVCCYHYLPESPKRPCMDCRRELTPCGTNLCGGCRSLRYRRARSPAGTGVYFQPWKGSSYGSCHGKPVLIVGESHYEYCPERWAKGDLMPANATQHILGDLIAPERERRAHWTKLAAVFLGHLPPRHPPNGEMYQFWHSVAYFNFMQECVGYENRGRVTHEMLLQSQPALEHVLGELLPSFVLVTSLRVWDYLPEPVVPREEERSGGVAAKVATYGLPKGSARFVGIPHPRSNAFGAARLWHPLVLDLLARCNQTEDASPVSLGDKIAARASLARVP